MYSNHFHYFLTLVQTLSYSEAAKRLFITQSALSQNIIALEKRYKVRLFDRTSSKICLTPEGELFYDMVLRIRESEKNFIRKVNEIQESENGHLSVAMTGLRCNHILPTLIPKFKLRYPHIDLDVIQEKNEDLEALVLSGKADMAVITRQAEHPSLTYIPIFETEIILCTPSEHHIAARAEGTFDWRNRPPIDLYDIKDEPFIMIKGYPYFNKQVEQIFESNGIAPKILMWLPDFHAVHQISRNGLAFALVHDGSAIQSFALGQRGIYFRLNKGPVKCTMKLCYKSTAYYSKIMDNFTHIFKEVIITLYKTKID